MFSNFFVGIGGLDVTGNFRSDATDITITDSSGQTAGTASITLADDDGALELPNIGDPIELGIGFGRPTSLFDGFVDDVDCSGSRGSGRMMTISAKTADTLKSKLKEQAEKHKDDTTFGSVAREWGQAAGIGSIYVHGDLAGIKREYWSMNNENFMAWGQRMARDLGATFKIMGSRAVFVPRSAGVSADGQPLTPISAVFGQNMISYQLKPALGRPQHGEFRSRWYDIKNHKWQETKQGASYQTQASAVMTSRYPVATEAEGKERDGALDKETDRERGGGSVELDGTPEAEPEAICTVQGSRPGCDGPYTIDSVTHKRSRGGGFTTSLSLKRPGEGTGAG